MILFITKGQWRAVILFNCDKTEHLSTEFSDNLKINGTTILTIHLFKYVDQSSREIDEYSYLDIERPILDKKVIVSLITFYGAEKL